MWARHAALVAALVWCVGAAGVGDVCAESPGGEGDGGASAGAVGAAAAATLAAHEAALVVAHPGPEGWEAIGDAFQEKRQWAVALKYHQQALDHDGTVVQAVAVATDLKHLLRYDEALAVLKLLPRSVRGHPEVALFEAAVLECSGRARKAVAIVRRVHGGAGVDHERDLQLLGYLERYHRSVMMKRAAKEVNEVASSSAPALQKLRESEALLAGEVSTLRAAMVATGRVGDEQFVRHYTPGLRAQPTYDVESPGNPDGVWAGVRDAANVLREHTSQLVREFQALEAAGLLESDDECLSDGWRRYEVSPGWRQVSSCDASHTPVACGMLQHITRSGAVRVLRGAYSTITAGAHIAPHSGTTNRQLKLHIGLEVPSEPRCAQIRVRDRFLTYAPGEVQMLDDSFEHEVWNNCTGRRTVFQLVFEHPDLQNR